MGKAKSSFVRVSIVLRPSLFTAGRGEGCSGEVAILISTSHGYIAGSCGHRVDPFNMEFCVWGLSMEVEPGFQRLRTI